MSLLEEFTNEQLAALTGAHVTSVRRWRRHKALPLSIVKLLEFTVRGRLDYFGWIGWTFQNGKLTAPDGFQLTAGEAWAIQLRKQQLAAYQAKERLLSQMDEQPAVAKSRGVG